MEVNKKIPAIAAISTILVLVVIFIILAKKKVIKVPGLFTGALMQTNGVANLGLPTPTGNAPATNVNTGGGNTVNAIANNYDPSYLATLGITQAPPPATVGTYQYTRPDGSVTIGNAPTLVGLYSDDNAGSTTPDAGATLFGVPLFTTPQGTIQN